MWKRVGISMAIVGLAGIVWSGAIWNQYLHVLPRHPEPAAGRVYPLNIHGIVVYHTREEKNWLNEIQYSSITVFAASALLAAIHRKRWGKPPAPPWAVESRRP